MMKYIDIGLTSLSWVLTVVQTEELFRIISLVCSIVCTLIIASSKLYEWYKKAKADGKITKDEVKEGVEIVVDTTKEITDSVNSTKKDEK